MFVAGAELTLADNDITGSINSAWGNRLAFRKLVTLDLSGNAMTGTLASGLGSAGAFPLLNNLDLSFNTFSGKCSGSLLLCTSWGTEEGATHTRHRQSNDDYSVRS